MIDEKIILQVLAEQQEEIKGYKPQKWVARKEEVVDQSRSGDGSLICCCSLNNPVTDARYSGQLSESCSLIA